MPPSIPFRLGCLAALLLSLAWLALPSAGADAGSDSEVDLTLSSSGRAFTNSVGMKLVPIRRGKFMMGSNDKGAPGNEKPRHEVELTRDFFMGAYEVTQKQWKTVMGNNPCYFCKTGGGGNRVQGMDTDDFPVESVSWNAVQKFLDKLEALPAERGAGRKYRLPTEAEWEYCCRAGTRTRYWTGDDLAARAENFNSVLNRPCKVGSYKPNAWGLYDMHGNVLEWCSDWFDEKAYGEKDRKDPRGPKVGNTRALRGGSWLLDGPNCRSAARRGYSPDTRSAGTFGFRVVCVASGS
jgi:formylglycine-generating enzyme required for sulfatase activity